MASDGVGARALPPRTIAARYRRESGFISLRYVPALLPYPLFMRYTIPQAKKLWRPRRTTKGGKPFHRMARDSTYVHPQCRVPCHQLCFVLLSSDKVKYYNRPNLAEVSSFPFNTSPTFPIAYFVQCPFPLTASHAARPLQQ